MLVILSFDMSRSTESAHGLRVGVGALLALLLSALVVEGVPLLHVHEADKLAIYNEECPLAGLAAHTAGAPLPSPVSSAVPLTVSQAPDLPAALVLPSPLLLSADPRAPPAS